jgi:hypothetical protein
MTDTNKILGYAEMHLDVAHTGELAALQIVEDQIKEFADKTLQNPEQPFGRVAHLIEVFKAIGLLITWHGEKAAAVALKRAELAGEFRPSAEELERQEITDEIVKHARTLCGGGRYEFTSRVPAAAAARSEMKDAVARLEELEEASEEDDDEDEDEDDLDTPVPYSVVAPDPEPESELVKYRLWIQSWHTPGPDGEALACEPNIFNTYSEAAAEALKRRQNNGLDYFVKTL